MASEFTISFLSNRRRLLSPKNVYPVYWTISFPYNPRYSSCLGDRRTVYDPDQLPRHRASSIAMVFTATIVSFDLSRT